MEINVISKRQNNKWIKYLQNNFGNYTNSVRTSGEVVGLIIVREIGLIFKFVLFGSAKYTIFCYFDTNFMLCNKILVLLYFKKKTPWNIVLSKEFYNR
jgi:hypothetical protein